ncbi:MAG: 4-hydroxy-tetrahydrodipicolinate synthase [Bacillota bacterium]|nr:4-hydroxy-tetrahydrodipicolinate synthase [Bacillota bacterium]
MSRKVRYEGIMPAMLTPFKANGELDLDGIKQNARFYLEAGCTGIVCNGSTGEAVNLSREERKAVIRATVEAVEGRLTVIAGTGAPTTSEAVALTRDALEAGADAALVITPFNAIPNKAGLFKHYAAVAEVGIPLIPYNLPAHTGVEIDFDTLDKLAELDTVVGIKESSGNLSYFAEVVRRVGDKLTVFTGADDLTLQAFCTGAPAAILALGNIAPRMLVDLLAAVKAGRLDEARKIYFSLLPIARAISSSVNFPAPVKEAVRLLGRPSSAPRLPILPVDADESASIRQALVHAGLLA